MGSYLSVSFLQSFYHCGFCGDIYIYIFLIYVSYFCSKHYVKLGAVHHSVHGFTATLNF